MVELSEDFYLRITNERTSPVFKNAILNLKEACNEIINLKGHLSTANVANHLKSKGKTPAYSTINNDTDGHLYYLKLRQHEYDLSAKERKSEKKIYQSKEQMSVTTDGLDEKQKRYIQILEHENKRLEANVRELSNLLSVASKSNPFDFAGSIEGGMNDDMSMTLVPDSESLGTDPTQLITHDLQKAIKTLVTAFKNGLPLITGNYDNNTCIFTNYSSSQEMILTPKQWNVLVNAGKDPAEKERRAKHITPRGGRRGQ